MGQSCVAVLTVNHELAVRLKGVDAVSRDRAHVHFELFFHDTHDGSDHTVGVVTREVERGDDLASFDPAIREAAGALRGNLTNVVQRLASTYC